MPADEQVGRFVSERPPDALVVGARVAADVGDPYPDAFALKTLVELEAATQSATVDVPADCFERLEFSQCVGDFKRTDIARMPNFVALFEVPENARVEVTVGVGNQTDALQADAG